MRLKARLTVGWEKKGTPRAMTLHEKARAKCAESKGGYTQKLQELASINNEIFGLDELFRRGPGGFNTIKKFIAALLDARPDTTQTLFCHIDYFAYTFLAKAKNIDLSLPADLDTLENLEKALILPWRNQILQLEQFEQFGRSPMEADRQKYLSLRPTALRETARDEWRAMVVLIQSGPSTMKEISRDLALGYTLGPRVVKPFLDTGAVRYRNHDLTYAVQPEYLPVILYFLRELLGLDMLGGF